MGCRCSGVAFAGPDYPTAQEYCTGFGTQIITCDFPDIFQMGR